MIYDLMMKATTKAAWDAFASSLPEGTLVDEIGPILVEGVVYSAWYVNVRVVYANADCAAIAAGNEDVTWLDPDEVSSPAREWSGGMNYWKPS